MVEIVIYLAVCFIQVPLGKIVNELLLALRVFTQRLKFIADHQIAELADDISVQRIGHRLANVTGVLPIEPVHGL